MTIEKNVFKARCLEKKRTVLVEEYTNATESKDRKFKCSSTCENHDGLFIILAVIPVDERKKRIAFKVTTCMS